MFKISGHKLIILGSCNLNCLHDPRHVYTCTVLCNTVHVCTCICIWVLISFINSNCVPVGPARAAEDCGRERQSLDPHTGEDQSTGATDRWGSLREHEKCNGNPNPRNQYWNRCLVHCILCMYNWAMLVSYMYHSFFLFVHVHVSKNSQLTEIIIATM